MKSILKINPLPHANHRTALPPNQSRGALLSAPMKPLGFAITTLLIQMCCLSGSSASAQPTQVQPVINPYQQSASIANSSTCGINCEFNFPQVPAGYRLVLTYVSAQLGPTADAVVVSGTSTGGNVDIIVPQPYPNSDFVSAPVTLYVDSGSAPRARIFRRDPSASASEIVTLVGHLVPMK